MTILRSFIYLLYLILSVLFFGSAIIVVGRFLSYRRRSRLAQLWAKSNLAALRLTCGLDYRISGWELLPPTNAIVLCKHQSAWETIALRALLPVEQTWVLKKELLRVPLVGWGLAAMKMISIDRAAGKDALDQVVTQGRERLQQGFYVILFPEGTRVAPGHKKRYKPGGAYLATHVGCKVVPVAHDAGELWPRQAFLKTPGTVTMSIGPAFDATGMTEAEVNQRAEAWIEDEMHRISPHRYSDASHNAT